MEPIRILHVVTTMHRAGLETMIMNYYRKLDVNKIQFDFLTYRREKSEYDEEILARGGKIYYLPPFSPRCIKENLKETKLFFKEHKEYKIVHSHIDALSAFPLLYAKKANIPVRIAHSHCSGFDVDIKYPVRLVARELLRNVATDFFACSKEAAQFMFGAKICKQNKYTIVKNAIECDKYGYNEEIRNETRKREMLEGKFVVGHIGRFVAPKNHMRVLEIFGEIKKQKKEAILLLVGQGELENQIKTRVKELGIESSVRFLGSRGDINELVQAMDLFILPSKYEGLGIVLIEAQTAGVPCLTSAKVVSKEAHVTELLEYVDLEEKNEIWAKKGLDMLGSERRSHVEEVRKAGFDINSNVNELANYYMSRWSE